MQTIKALLLVPIQLAELILLVVWKLTLLLLRLAGWRPPVVTGEDYERYAADYLRRQGFRNIQHTKRTGDLGVDLVAQKGLRTYAVQCKYYTHPVDGSAIQEVVAGKACYGCDTALVVTNSTLTAGAWTLAENNRVEVLTGIVPAEEPGRFSLEKALSPRRLVGFAAGCVLSGTVLSHIQSGEKPLPIGSCVALAALCFLLSGLAVTAWCALWRRVWK